MKKIFGLLTAILLVVTGWFFASPYYVVYQLKNAYDNHNVEVINAHINFPSVQNDIKSQLKPILVKKVQTLTQSPIAKLLNVQVDETAIIDRLVTQAVDNSVTPDTVKSVITTQGNVSNLNTNVKLLGGLTAVAMDKITLNVETLAEFATAKNTAELNQQLFKQLETSDMANGGDNQPTAHYCGLNCFEVQTQVQGYPLNIEMTRQGFSNWQIVKVKLPF